jgi:hypothetical protein
LIALNGGTGASGIHIAQPEGIQGLLHRRHRNLRFIIKPQPASVTGDLPGPIWKQRHLEPVEPKRLAGKTEVDIDP